uniref:Uncharacterized protein n=1 Tax=Solanum lycopersicum TaxID=4081 RepID=A0A3Q7HST4_SOLLC
MIVMDPDRQCKYGSRDRIQGQLSSEQGIHLNYDFQGYDLPRRDFWLSMVSAAASAGGKMSSQVTSPEMFTGKMSNLHPPSLDDLGLNLDTNLTSDDILPLADVDAATILNPKSLGVSKQSQIDPNGFEVLCP